MRLLEDKKMVKQHKHKGVERSNGSLRLHPVSRKHSDPRVQKWHNEETGKVSKPAKPNKKSTTTVNFERHVMVPVDKEGYIHIDLTQNDIKQKGLRVKFIRQRNRTKRTVGLQIEK